MIISPARINSSKRDLEAVAWLFEQLLLDSGSPADRLKVRRAIDEAASAWPPGEEDRWWKWIYETGRSLGLRCKVVDCTFNQLLEISKEGGQLITRVGEDHQWKAIDDHRRRHFQLLCPMLDNNRAWVKPQRLKEEFQLHDRDDIVRCVVIEPRLSGADQSGVSQSERTPLQRALALMHAERSDIWVILVYATVTGILGLATPLAVEALVSTVAFGRVLQPVIIVALMLFAFLAFSAVIVALQTYVVEIIQRRLFARVVADLSFRLPRVEMESLDGKDGRELVNRFFDIVTVQKVAASMLLEGISVVLFAVIGMAVLAFYHPWLLGFDVVLLMMLAFVVLVLGRGAVKTCIKESKTKYHTADWLEQLAARPTAFRYAGACEFALDRADHLTYEYLKARQSHFRILFRQIGFSLGVQAVASTVLLGIGGWLVISGELTLGQLVAAELIVAVIVGAFAKLGKYMEIYYDLMASVDKLGVLFDLPMERQDGLLYLTSDRPAEVVINDLSYPGRASTPGLRDVNLIVRPGDRLMLTGPGEAGKSLLLDLLFGLRSPRAGHISINNVDPRDLRPDALRRSVALVREVEIFAGTIAENIHLERPDISSSDVREVLSDVGLIDEVLRMPKGLETELSTEGYPLTRQQCLILMIARALVARPTLLLVDGTLDGLNDDNVSRLTALLVDARQPWTLIVATGREAIADTGSQTFSIGTKPVPTVNKSDGEGLMSGGPRDKRMGNGQ